MLLWDANADNSTRVLEYKCGKVLVHNTTLYVPNFVAGLETIGGQIRQYRFGVAVTGSGPNFPDDTFSFAQCYSNISENDCVLCYAEARTVLPQCFPYKAAAIYLGGCFLRVDNYSFLQEYSRPDDKVVCKNGTRKSKEFYQAVVKGLSNAIKNNGYTLNEAVYILAECWKPLTADSCRACLKNASASLSTCLPSSQGFALNTGCIMRYADTDFLNTTVTTKLENASSRGPKNSSSRGGQKSITIVAAICSVGFVVGVVIGCYVWKHRKLQNKRKGANDQEKFAIALRDGNLECKYSTLKKATGSFDEANRLGQGGFGTVYKGILPDRREIAVKRLFFNNHHRAADFYNEVKIISSVRHKNLVKLLGCSCSGPESLLVYELLPNGSLDRFLFEPSKGKVLNWEKRFNIITGTAEGLVYLHENTETRIVHRDIKASNILLDSKLNAKIADFGLARCFEQDKSHISTAIAGTLGYMAPEYIGHGQLTEKADVYSFGVLLLEIVTGRQNNRIKTSECLDNLVTTMWKHFQQGRVQELFDTNLMANDNIGTSIDHEMILRVVQVGLLCTQKLPLLRPPMSTALQMLSRKDEQLPSPSAPPYVDDDELTSGLGDLQINPGYWPNLGNIASNAGISYTTFYPR